MTLAEQDKLGYFANRDTSVTELLTYAAKKTGRSVFQIHRDFKKLSKSPMKVNLAEYVRMGLFDTERFNAETRSTFISNDLHWSITHQCNDKTWSGAAEDKVLAGTLLEASGVPVPETVAVLDRSQRRYPKLAKIGRPDDLDLLRKEADNGPLFCKIANGMVSFGAFRIESIGKTTVRCTGHPEMTHAQFLDDFVGQNAYVVQRELTNHAEIGDYASALCTVRMVNLITDEGVHCPAAVIKMPQGDNIADAFWRSGNLACDIDVQTGRIRTVARRGIETEYLNDHPVTPGLMGLELPFWSELKDINARAAQTFAPIRYQSTDVAITQNGPVVVEINYGGGFDLPQYASGRGLFTPELRRFFESCGVSFETAKKRRGLLARKRA